jgi:hypothetical protein
MIRRALDGAPLVFVAVEEVFQWLDRIRLGKTVRENECLASIFAVDDKIRKPCFAKIRPFRIETAPKGPEFHCLQA